MKTRNLIAISFVFVFLMLLPVVFALRQTVGKIALTVAPGGTNNSYYGLTNDLNETITVKLRTEGDAAPYIQIPSSLELPPDKFVQVDVMVSMPSDYDFSKGNSITGYIYALLEGEPGQVQINVQTRKTVEINVLGSKESQSLQSPISESSLSGYSSLLANPILILAVSLIAGCLFFGLIFRSLKKRGR